MTERVNSFISKYQAKIAACVSDKEGDPKLKRYIWSFYNKLTHLIIVLASPTTYLESTART